MSGSRCALFAATRKPATPPATHTTCRRGTETGKGERDTKTLIPKTPHKLGFSVFPRTLDVGIRPPTLQLGYWVLMCSDLYYIHPNKVMWIDSVWYQLLYEPLLICIKLHQQHLTKSKELRHNHSNNLSTTYTRGNYLAFLESLPS